MVKRLSESGDMGNFGKGKFIPRPRKKRTQSAVSEASIERFFNTTFKKEVCKAYGIESNRVNHCLSLTDFDMLVDEETGKTMVYVDWKINLSINILNTMQDVVENVYRNKIRIDAYTTLIPDYDQWDWWGKSKDMVGITFYVQEDDSLDSDSEKLPYQRFESYRRTRLRKIRERIESTPEMRQDFADMFDLIRKRLSKRGYAVKREGVADNTWLAMSVSRPADTVYDDFFIDMENLENVINTQLWRTGYAQDYEVSVGNIDGKRYSVEIIPKEMRASARAW